VAEPPSEAASSTEIDRWWATAGQADAIDVTWVVGIPAGAERGYQFDLDFTGDLLGLANSWSLTGAATVAVDGGEVLSIGGGAHQAVLGTLGAGTHQIVVSGLLPPETPLVQELVFKLHPETSPGSGVFDTGESAVQRFAANFIADHPGGAESLVFPLNVQTDGDSLSVGSLDALVDQFAPVLHFSGNERYAVPLDVTALQRNSGLPDGRAWVFDPGRLDGAVGSPDQTLDLSGWADAEFAAHGANVRPAVYSSVLHDESRDEIAINYYFFYPRSNWAEHGGFNTHEGDWEGATLFLTHEGGAWVPTSLAVAQHEQRLVIGEDGLDFVDWDDLYLGDDSGTSTHPHLFVGLGAHATYAARGETDWGVGLTRVEDHSGTGIGDPSVQQVLEYIPTPEEVHYLPRVGEESGVPNWLRYPGRWGRENAGTAFLYVTSLGDDGPHGPAFGDRWLDPWDWAGAFVEPGYVTDIVFENHDNAVPPADFRSPVVTAPRFLGSASDGRQIDVTFMDRGASRLFHATIVDAAPEFSISGSAVPEGVAVSDFPPQLVSINRSTGEAVYRYWLTGRLTGGELTLDFPAGAWRDLAGNGNPAFELVTSFVDAANDVLFVSQDSGPQEMFVLPNDGPVWAIDQIVSHTEPSQGTAAWTPYSFFYTPDPGYSGLDTLEYTIADETGARSSADVFIYVRPAAPQPAFEVLSLDDILVDRITSEEFLVFLTGQPTTDVTITATSDLTDLTVTPGALTLTPDNWDQPQVIRVENLNPPSQGIRSGNLTLSVVDDLSDDAFDDVDDQSESLFVVSLGPGDVTYPTVESITRVDPNPTGTDSVVFAVTFSEDVDDIDVGDFVLVTSGTAAGTIARVSAPGGAIVEVTVNNLSGDGTLGLSFDADASGGVVDLNGNVAVTDAEGEAYDLDRIAPRLLSITRWHPEEEVTRSDSVAFLVLFSEAVTSVDAADFEIVSTSTAQISAVEPADEFAPEEIIVRVSGGDLAEFNGSLELQLAEVSSIFDDVGNRISGEKAVSTESFTLDNSGPTVTVRIAEVRLSKGTRQSGVTFEFSESVTDFELSDVAVVNGTLSNFAGSGTSYSATFTADDGVSGTASVSVAAGAAADAAGNSSGAGSDSVTIDTANASLVVNVVQTSLSDGRNSSDVTFEFSESVTGFELSDIAVVNGTLTDFSGSGASYSATFTADDGVSGTGSVSVAAGAAADAAGNSSGAGSDSVTIDTQNPMLTVNVVDASLSDGDNTSNVTFTFSEAVTDFDASDVTVVNGTLSNFTGSGASYSATFIADDGVSGTGSVAAGTAYTDIAGNTGTGGGGQCEHRHF
jgi:hypothetical protein